MTDVLDGKVALVTGATSGIGRAIAQRFAAEGARVFFTGRRQDALDLLAAELGNGAVAIRADTSVSSDVDALFTQIAQQTDRVDVLVANAGAGSRAGLSRMR
jgi:NAD(P)-dependent dehydrogenase (short-subunit alcohol dehydrogenase family)